MNPGGDLEIPLNTSQTEALRLRIFETVIHSCPAHFFIAFAANGADAPAWITAWKAAAGRGLDRENARQAAIFEAVERASTMTGGPDDPRARDSRTPPEGAIPAESLWQYSADQLLKLYANKNFSSLHGCGKPVDNLWMEGIHLTRGTRHPLPATAVLLDEDARLGLGSPFTSSTGTAARDDLDAATRHALMERVERDAVAIWWYNRLLAPRIAPEAARRALPMRSPRGATTAPRTCTSSLPTISRRSRWSHFIRQECRTGRVPSHRPGMPRLDPARAVLAADGSEMLQGGDSRSRRCGRSASSARTGHPPPAMVRDDGALALHRFFAGTEEDPPSPAHPGATNDLPGRTLDAVRQRRSTSPTSPPELAFPWRAAVSGVHRGQLASALRPRPPRRCSVASRRPPEPGPTEKDYQPSVRSSSDATGPSTRETEGVAYVARRLLRRAPEDGVGKRLRIRR